MNEKEMIERIQNGEEEFFDNLIERYIDELYYLAIRLIGNPNDAEDIVQDTLLKVYQKINTFRGDSQFRTWVYRIAINMCKQYYRKNKIKNLFFPWSNNENTYSDGKQPDKNVIADETQQLINESITELPYRQKTIFLLRQEKKMKYDEIAVILNINVNTAKTNYFFAIKNLKKILKKKGVAL